MKKIYSRFLYIAFLTPMILTNPTFSDASDQRAKRQQIATHRLAPSISSKNATSVFALKQRDFVIALAVDGGGIRGIVPAVLTAEIEQKLNMRLTQFIDIFGGTSAGSILISLLNTKNPKTGQPRTAAECVKLVDDIGNKIFSTPLSSLGALKRSVRTAGGMLGSKYSAKFLETFLQESFPNNLPINHSIKPLVIPTYDFTYSTAKVFTDADQTPLWQVVRASTAAPTLFKGIELQMKDAQGQITRHTMVDGGIAGAMSPDLFLYDQIRKKYRGKKIFFISLGTGRDVNKSGVRGKGMFAGSVPLVLKRTIISGLEAPIEMGKTILSSDENVEYHRIDVQLPKNCAYDVDNASAKNRACLKALATQIAKGVEFQNLLGRLQQIVRKQTLDLPTRASESTE